MININICRYCSLPIVYGTEHSCPNIDIRRCAVANQEKIYTQDQVDERIRGALLNLINERDSLLDDLDETLDELSEVREDLDLACENLKSIQDKEPVFISLARNPEDQIIQSFHVRGNKYIVTRSGNIYLDETTWTEMYHFVTRV
jgi:hypothetical protein